MAKSEFGDDYEKTTVLASKDIELFTPGKQGRSALGDFLLGSTARRLLAESEADVLVIPQPAAVRRVAADAQAPARPKAMDPLRVT